MCCSGYSLQPQFQMLPLYVVPILFFHFVASREHSYGHYGSKSNDSPLASGTTIKSALANSSCNLQFFSSFTAADFPTNFQFGVATAAYQIEGATLEDGRGPSIWDSFAQIPGKILNGDNASIADDSYHKYLEDIELMRAMGTETYRFSISWSRILPDGTGRINPLGIEYYNKLIDSLIASKIKPALTMYHWDLPEALHTSMGGWLNESIVDHFLEYADLLFHTYGDRVKTWVTFNEPMETSVQGYALATMAPGRCSNRTVCPNGGNSSTEPYIVAHNILKSHAAAVNLYRNKYQQFQGGRIGITLDSQYYFPATNSTEDLEASSTALQFSYGWFADPVIFGDYPIVMKDHVGSRMPGFTLTEKRLLRGSVDFLAVNSYTGLYVSPGVPPVPGTGYPWSDGWIHTTNIGANGALIGEPTASPWLFVVPKAIYGIVMWIHNRYTNIPIIVTESGTSDPGNSSLTDVLCDQHRIVFYETYLGELLNAIMDGANVQGFFAWSLIDNFEWAAGYSQRFGIHYVDFDDPDRPRYPKLSAFWWSYFLRTP